MTRKYLSVDEQIKYLKDRNLLFVDMDEQEAKRILMTETYFHKIVSYKHYFSKYKVLADGDDNYNHIDFNDLYELSVIDHQLRRSYNEICLNIEKYFKVFLLRFIERSGSNVNEYFFYRVTNLEKIYRINTRMEKRIKDFGDVYSRKNIEKYPDEKPMWVLNEYLSFGEVLEIFNKYLRKHPHPQYDEMMNYLKIAKQIRNACAHNNVLFSKNETCDMCGISLKKDLELNGIYVRENQIHSNFTYKLVATLLVYKELAPREQFELAMNDLFLTLHTLIKTNKIFKKHENEQVIIDFKNLYKIVNKMY